MQTDNGTKLKKESEQKTVELKRILEQLQKDLSELKEKFTTMDSAITELRNNRGASGGATNVVIPGKWAYWQSLKISLRHTQ